MKQAAVDQLIGLLLGAQGAYFGEPVTQLEHALQCAALARAAGGDEDLILAALLHDIGHLVAEGDEMGVPDHDQVGAWYLRNLGIGNRVVELVSGHVQAKRYLTAVHPNYYQRLSEASKQTLELQGGPMSAEEVAAFEQDPMGMEKLRLRAWDEQAKVPGLPVPDIESFRELLIRN